MTNFTTCRPAKLFLIFALTFFTFFSVKVSYADVVNVVPNAKHANDTSTEEVSEITADDSAVNPDTLSVVAAGDGTYTVDRLAVMQFTTFDVSSIPGGSTITAAALHFQFGAEDGYNGTNPVRYDNGAGLTTTGIAPTDITGFSADQSFNLFAAGVDTLNEIQNVDIEFTNNDSASADAIHFDYLWITVTYTPPAMTSIGDGTDPSNVTLAPGASATDLDTFTLQTSSGSDTVTAATVTLASGTSGGLSLVAITNNAGSTTYCSSSNPASDTVSLTSCGIPVTTSLTSFKIRITPKSHANMPAPPGSTYSVTGTVTSFTSTNSQSGTDTDSATVTIDNASPANVTSASGSAGDTQVSLSWTNPADSDFHSTIVLRRAGTATSDTPTEGTTYVAGNTIGSSIVACVEASPATNCTDAGLTNGTAYHYRIYTKDSNVNYSATGVVPTGSPVTPAPSADATAPAAVTDLATGSVTSSTIAVSWTAPGDDGSSGTATTYDLRYSTSAITEGNFSSATQVAGEPTPSVAGSSESKTVSGLSASTTYYFALKTSDEVPNTSALSNVPSGTTSAPPSPPPPPSPLPPPGGSGIQYAKAFFAGIAFPDGVVEVSLRNRLDPPTQIITVASSTTKSDGSFEMLLDNLISGDYLFTLRVRDKLGRDSGILGYNVDFIFGTGSFRDDDIFVPPVIGFQNARVGKGDNLEMNGYAAPGNKVEIAINGILKGTVAANNNGFYTFSVDTLGLEGSEYYVKARQIDADGRVSAYSPLRFAKLAALAIPEADLNNDNIVNISDWSIFLFRWGSSESDARKTIDFDKNGIVNISDFAIFLNALR